MCGNKEIQPATVLQEESPPPSPICLNALDDHLPIHILRLKATVIQPFFFIILYPHIPDSLLKFPESSPHFSTKL